METKKSPKANLENKRKLFFQLGLIITLGFTLAAFEWSTRTTDNTFFLRSPDDVAFEELVINTRNESEKKEQHRPIIIDLRIVPDESPALEDPIFFDPTIGIDGIIAIDRWTEMPDEKPDGSDSVFVRVEEMPKFMGGGLEKFWKYVQENVNYPDEAREAGLQGKIVASFVVNEKGNIENIKLPLKIHPVIDNEVIQVLEEAPQWTPGKQRKRPVKVGFSIPVIFKLSQ